MVGVDFSVYLILKPVPFLPHGAPNITIGGLLQGGLHIPSTLVV